MGKAAALLFVRAGITAVYAKVLSKSAQTILSNRNIYFEYDVLTDKILNRANTGICPMEKAVADTNDADEGFRRICNTLRLLKSR